MGVSRAYIYMALKDDFAVTEDFYKKLKALVKT
jgi:hypothetical protein